MCVGVEGHVLVVVSKETWGLACSIPILLVVSLDAISSTRAVLVYDIVFPHSIGQYNALRLHSVVSGYAFGMTSMGYVRIAFTAPVLEGRKKKKKKKRAYP